MKIDLTLDEIANLCYYIEMELQHQKYTEPDGSVTIPIDTELEQTLNKFYSLHS